VTCSSSCTRIFHFLVYLNKLMDTSSNYQNTRQWYKEKKRKNKNYINNKHFCTVYEFHVYLVRVAVPITHIYTRNLLLEYNTYCQIIRFFKKFKKFVWWNFHLSILIIVDLSNDFFKKILFDHQTYFFHDWAFLNPN
jgi:hypothetical protein